MGLNFSVRNGKRWTPMLWSPTLVGWMTCICRWYSSPISWWRLLVWSIFLKIYLIMLEYTVATGNCTWTELTCKHESGSREENDRAISTARLNTSLRVHLPPIYVVIFYGSQGKTHLVGGFALRCFQCLSHPDIATQRCDWRHNWYTSGQSNPVLSY